MRSDATRNASRILSAARDLVTERGPSVSMDAIAAAAGVAVGTLYRHHPTKADLIAAILEDSIGLFAQTAEAAADKVLAGADPGSELTTLILEFAEQHAKDRALKAAAAALGAPVPEDIDQFPADSAARRLVTAAEAVLDHARRAGAVRKDITVADLLILVNGLPQDHQQRQRYLTIMLSGITITT